LNSLTITINNTDTGTIYIQEGYYPTTEWFLDADLEIDDDEGFTHATILSPGNPLAPETYFIGIYNYDTSTQTVNVSTVTSQCSGSGFGYNCTHNFDNTTNTPMSNVQPLSATITLNDLNPGTNNGTSLSFDYSDDDYDDQFAYFSLTSYPDLDPGQLWYVRVTVANNDISDENGAPPFFAKLGSIPSEQSNQYNLSTLGEVAHQFALPITPGDITPDQTWFLAVKLPVDFSIWLGVNCANNCSDDKHGSCYCGNVTCQSVTLNGVDLTPFYLRPGNLQDSGGACSCDNIDFAQSYDCTEKNNGYVGIYLLLLLSLFIIVLLLSVGVPVYCFIAKKRSVRHEREGLNYETI